MKPSEENNGKIVISFVVLNHNRAGDLRRNLARLKEISTVNTETIVVDNASTDSSVQMVEELFPEVNLVKSATNTGVSIGRNLGFRKARGEFIICLDDDIIAPKNIAVTTAAIFHTNPRVGCLAYLIRQMPEGHYLNQCTRDTLTSYRACGHAFRHEALRSIGYLDEALFFGAEEIDSSLRLMNNGYLTRYTPEIIIEHYGLVSKLAYSRRISKWIAGWGFFYIKNFPLHTACLLVSRLFISHLIAALKRHTLAAYFKGLWEFTRQLPLVLRGRNVASPATIKFFMDPHCEPYHYSRSFRLKFLDKIRSGLRRSDRNFPDRLSKK